MSKPIKIISWVVGILVLIFVVIGVLTVWTSYKESRGIKTGSAMYGGGPSGEGGSFGLSYGTATGLGQSSGGLLAKVQEKFAGSESGESGAAVSDNAQNLKTDRMIIKTGSLAMVVKDVKSGIAAITQYAEKNGGFVVSSNVNKQGVAPYGEITIRIPSKLFDKGVADLKSMGQVESEQVNGQDVTEEYVDLTAQLKNLRAAEEQFLVIMRQATQINDILAVQRELTNIRGQVERIQGQMKYLEQSAKLSTISAYLSTDPDVLPAVDQQDKWKPWGQVKSAARSLLSVGKGLANFVIWLIIYIPLWLVIGLAVWGIVKGIRWARGRRI
ncbi:MAG: DUF4349 domain-containing protein [Candidatus Magasanikbacteria bacterium]|nr:DUF4349 domain-containing protein [Candidatus Magasanikbacteria bacterium]